MKAQLYQEALDAFANPFHEFTVEPMNEGSEQSTFKITSKVTGKAFLLQEIDLKIFPNPGLLQDNYEKIWKFLQAEKIPYLVPAPKYFPDDNTLYNDSLGKFWRVFEFMENCYSIPVAENSEQARAVAQAFGGFTASLEEFDVTSLHTTVPHIHDLAFYYRQFQRTLHTHHYDRLMKSATLIDDVKLRGRFSSFYEVLMESGQLPRRVIHHNARITNILFDKETQAVICPINFDLVMPGYIFSDLGEMIRSMVSTKAEDSIEYNEIQIRDDIYEAIIGGYLSLLEPLLSELEMKYLHFSGLMITYMRLLHFLTAYLQGDSNHFPIDYKEQNFDRAMNQLVLLQRLEEFLLKQYGFKV